MSRTLIIAEIATAHGGSVDLAADMIRAAADAGADYAKLQSYGLAALNPKDPQAEWLIQAHLDKAAHERLLKVGGDCGIQVFSTPFEATSLQMLRELGLKTFKIASSESGNEWWVPERREQWFVSYPWGEVPAQKRIGGCQDDAEDAFWFRPHAALTAIPLYPTPLETVNRATLLDGWSDHCEGISACQWAIAQGVKVIEAHLCLPGRSRVKSFDKTPAQFRELRAFADACETMRSGVGQTFRERWSRSA